MDHGYRSKWIFSDKQKCKGWKEVLYIYIYIWGKHRPAPKL